MQIRNTKIDELDTVLEIYKNARKQMTLTGNPEQWENNWPPKTLIKQDIERNESFVCVQNKKILGVFAYLTGPDPTYLKIEDGQWLNNSQYGVIHRIASTFQTPGILHAAVQFALNKCGNIRIDTHKNNTPMRAALKKEGFSYCGIIYTHHNKARMAFQKDLSYINNVVSSIANYCMKGEKSNTCGKFGIEVEHLIFDHNNRSLTLYSNPNIHQIIENLKQYYDAAIYDIDLNENKYIKKLKRRNAEVTFEPGGQIEVALIPHKEISSIKSGYEKFLSELNEVCAKFGCHVKHIGYRPDKCSLEVPIIQANRYLCMDARFRNSGTHGTCMMRNSASVQVSIDYISETDCEKKLKIALCLSPIIYFLLDNSPIFETQKVGSNTKNISGIPIPKRMARYQIWKNTDSDRTGAITSAFNKFSYINYANQIVDIPLIYARKSQRNLIDINKTTKIGEDWHIGAYRAKDIAKNNKLSDDEIQHMLSMGFFDARLKNFIELRAADCIKPEYIYAYVAFLKGIFCNKQSYDKIWNIFQNQTMNDYEKAGNALYKHGWSASIFSRNAHEFIADVFETSYCGLASNEKKYLQPILKLIKDRKVIKDLSNKLYTENHHEFKPLSKTEENTLLQVKYYLETKGDIEGRKKSLEVQKMNKAIYANKIVRQGYFSKIYSVSERLIFEDLISTITNIFNKIIDYYYQDKDYAKLFKFNEFEQRLINYRPKYSSNYPIGRIDIFFDDKTGHFKFCEFNAAGSAAMNEVFHICKAARQSGCFKHAEANITKNGKHVEELELFSSWNRQFVKIYNDWCKNTNRKPALPNGTTQFAIIDFLDNCAINDLYHFEETFNARGYKTKVIDIHDLTFDGNVLSTKKGYQIDAFYKRVTLDDLYARRNEDGVDAMIQAVEADAVCPIDWFNTQIIHDKQICYILTHPKTKKILTESENSFINIHQPATFLLNESILDNIEFVNNKDSFICKPISSRGAKDIYPGKDFDKTQWVKILQKCCKQKNYIIQEYATQSLTPNVCIDPYNTQITLNSNYKKTITSYSNMEGLYCYNGKFAGIYLRQGLGSINSRNLNNIDCATFYEM